MVEELCATLWEFLKGLVENFRVDLNRSVAVAFRLGPIGFQFHADTVFVGITLRFSGVMHRKIVGISLRAKKMLILWMASRSSKL